MIFSFFSLSLPELLRRLLDCGVESVPEASEVLDRRDDESFVLEEASETGRRLLVLGVFE